MIFNCKWCNSSYCVNCKVGTKDFMNYCSIECEKEADKVDSRNIPKALTAKQSEQFLKKLNKKIRKQL